MKQFYHFQKRTVFFLLFFLLGLSIVARSQTPLDNFNRANNATVGNGWVQLNSNFPYIFTNSNITDSTLRINANNASADYLIRDASGGTYNTVLDSNNIELIWAFNMRQPQPDPNGFNVSSTNGIAFILGANDYITPLGYAVVLGDVGKPDKIRLVHITGGIGNEFVEEEVIAAGDYGNEYLSIKVIYNPDGNLWSLFAESDPDTFPQADPRRTATQIGGSVVDNKYTNLDLKYLVLDWHHSESPGDYATFDDIYIPSAEGDLPVSLRSFTGQRVGNTVQLNWKTTAEDDNAGFEVQRSADLRNFTLIGFVPASDHLQTVNTYSFTDESYHPSSYYRLKQLDRDGQYEYSKPIFIEENSSVTVEGLLVYPSPTEGKIHLALPDATEARLTLISPQGKTLASFSALPTEMDEQLSEQFDRLPAGVYVLLTNQGSQFYRNKIVKR